MLRLGRKLMIDRCVPRQGQTGAWLPATRVNRAARTVLLAATAAMAAAGPAKVMAQLGVTEGGQSAYSHPIVVPPGIAGMQPNLSIAYAQGGINGPLGAGWSLQGLSSITRCPATLAADGKRAGVRYGPSDKLCMDGQRLIQTDENGNPSAATNSTGIAVAGQADDAKGLPSATTYREFRTEKDSFVRVRAYGNAGTEASGPALFRVWTKTGQIYEYGNPGGGAYSALVTAHGKTAVAAWPVVSIREPSFGNRIDFRYEVREMNWGSGPTAGSPIPGREWNIREILYTGGKVVFTYTDRTSSTGAVPHDAAEAYHEGSKMVGVRRLDAISTYINIPGIAGLAAPPVKTYKLRYTQGSISGRSSLAGIRECVGDATSPRCLPETAFYYHSGGSDAYQASGAFNLATLTMHSTSGNYGVLQGDYNGDGKTDFIRWADAPAENQLYTSNGDGSFTRNTAFNITDQNLFKSDACYNAMLADMDGDGVSDILRYAGLTKPDGAACASPGTSVLYSGRGDGTFVRRSITGVTLERLVSQLTRGCEDGSTPQAGVCANGRPQILGWSRGNGFYVLDIDGDGKADIVTAALPAHAPAATYTNPCANTACTRVYRGDGLGNFAEITPVNVTQAHFYTAASAGAGRIQPVIDLDGDSLADLTDVANQYTTQFTSWRSRGDGNFDAFPFSRRCTNAIDFNGDSRPDCLQTPSQTASGNALKVSTGASSEQLVAGFNLNGAGNELEGGGVGFLVADFNGDMRQDILRWKDDPAQNVIWWSNGDGTFRVSPGFNIKSTVLRSSSGGYDFIIGDFTGQGTVEILRTAAGAAGATTAATQNQLFVKSGWLPPDTLNLVVQPTGSRTTLTYAPLLNTGIVPGYAGRYVSDRAAGRATQPPLAELAVPMPVVVSMAADSGVGSQTIVTQYAYAGLKTDLNGRGTVGFREVRRQSPGPNGEPMTVVTQYLQKYPYIGVAGSTETRRGTLTDTSAPRLAATSNRYCETSASAAQRAAATVDAPCEVTSPTRPRMVRPYLLSSTEQGWDLTGTPLPTVVTTNAVNNYGDTTSVRVETTGTLAGAAQVFVNETTNTFCEPNAANCPNKTSGDNWILGRLERATVRQTAPNSLAALTAPTPLSVAVVPGTLQLTTVTSGTTVGGAATVSSSGGVAPYSYSWQRISGSRINVSGAQLATFSAAVNYNETFTETFRVTLTDGAGTTATATLNVTAVGPPPPPVISVAPASHDYGSVRDSVSATQAFTVTNSGGAWTFRVTLTTTEYAYSLSNGTCPANGAAMSAASSCTVNVSFRGSAQCGGSPITRSATLTITVANPHTSSSGTSALTARHFVYKATDLPCR
jgi:hypothetical protein